MTIESFHELLCFILTSARGCIDEPPIYGPLRLLETFSKLIDLYAKHDNKMETFWKSQQEEIESYKDLALLDKEMFVNAMDQTLINVAQCMLNKTE